jgi:transposase
MMGRKDRTPTPISALTLEELVPADHFYRHLDRVLDLSFVHELVRGCYAEGVGRPSIDPVIFFRLQLVMFFEGIRSERLLMRLVADRLSIRWYLGYNLGEPLPDHSSLTRIRERYGLEVFRQFFETIVEQCQQAGLVWGRELYVDATHVLADAALDSLAPRFAVEARAASQATQATYAHLDGPFSQELPSEPASQQVPQDRQDSHNRAPWEDMVSASTAADPPRTSRPHRCRSCSATASGPHWSPPMRPGTTGLRQEANRSARSAAPTITTNVPLISA